jgi:hypothetical protein
MLPPPEFRAIDVIDYIRRMTYQVCCLQKAGLSGNKHVGTDLFYR